MILGNDIGKLVDIETKEIIFKHKVPKYGFKFIEWLEKIVSPNPSNRYENAKIALEALKPLYVMRFPEVEFNQSELNFIEQTAQVKLSQTITLTNDISETTLEGELFVVSHPNDPPHTPDHHAWIRITPRQFKNNKVDCVVTINSRKLKPDSEYDRDIILRSNTKQKNHHLKVKVKTAPIKMDVEYPPYKSMILSRLMLIVPSIFLGQSLGMIMQDPRLEIEPYYWYLSPSIPYSLYETIYSSIPGTIWLLMIALLTGVSWGTYYRKKDQAIINKLIYGSSYGLMYVLIFPIVLVITIMPIIYLLQFSDSIIKLDDVFYLLLLSPLIIIIGLFQPFFDIFNFLEDMFSSESIWIFSNFILMVIGTITGAIYGLRVGAKFYENLYQEDPEEIILNFPNIWPIFLGILIGLGKIIGFNLPLMITLITFSLPFVIPLFYPLLKSRILKANYRRLKSRNLIEP